MTRAELRALAREWYSLGADVRLDYERLLKHLDSQDRLVFELLAQGYSQSEIARRVGVLSGCGAVNRLLRHVTYWEAKLADH